MTEEKQQEPKNTPRTMTTEVGVKAARKLHARRQPEQKVWLGLGMMGLIGWSVAVPTLLGAGLGIYIDTYHPSERSWTLALLVAGLAMGCFNAWHWVSKEERAIHAPENEVSNSNATSSDKSTTEQTSAEEHEQDSVNKEASQEKKTTKK
ncbi:AtpZ/AtpI family protein [Brumicola nitratireducens]|uniref:F0F1-ATPase subunit n=1 Tax=Glaciecola nitratireducens (strain JCM 12485 / KCTC 12276 / FR1064) TaxID=1085623 RepID=G4QN40_GLANF|nr:AtpZ/AtpI family protein [Glaciecola nitratireducens]AEP31459.1 F0F1-ATPase subunit [Glaciecola nitratireducens FR1064]